jgi:hypothetical protein
VNAVQIRELSDILTLLDTVLESEARPYFITIDRLDENWIDERFRHVLIRALIETVRDFRKVRNAKIVVALRRDLLDRVFRLTRDPGFQEEKYESIYLDLSWTRDRLVEVLDRRVQHLVKRQYTNAVVTHAEILPASIRSQDPVDYIIARTLMRPRDLIMFFNKCIELATDKATITAEMLREAEGEYSRFRLRALADEWAGDFPNLIAFSALLKGRPDHVALAGFTDAECSEFALNLVTRSEAMPDDPLARAARQLAEGYSAPDDFRRVIALVFYNVGLVGLKLATFEAPVWASGGRRSVSSAEIDCDTRVYINPSFWRTLGVREPKTRGGRRALVISR